MKAEIFKHRFDWYIEYYENNGKHIRHCGECISGFEREPLKKAIERAKWWGCKSICVSY